ncbi:Ger(x)C family germination protein [Anoxybacillus voinovskiensis]|uniref:Ger(X)C family germination protein n=1 Tax=Anoxybacteroides voinovskiense TaxID=230470 RepID=A0A840DV56_9BACL|nr:Ger(x)C family spore germination protein [Anoxybacillus voinovskiensis]MBB4073898.1 Ger(x)C family germination protein [Anoxybacillus voinovskiensis]GGJ66298.1 putative spore germination protein YfkR [Anoxybacillus voinovskiensis]
MKIKILLPLLLSFMLSGCWGAKNVDQLTYVHAIGIDYKNNKFTVYVQVINFQNLAKIESGGGKEESSVAIEQATGETFNIATDKLYAAMQQRVSWGHVQSIIFSKNALRPDVFQDVFDVLGRYNEIRHTIWIYATDSSLKQLLQNIPVLNGSPYYSRLSNPWDVYRQSSFIRPLRLNRFIAYANEKAETVHIPLMNSSKKDWEENRKAKPMLKTEGACFLEGYKLKLCEQSDKLSGLRWVEPGVKRTPIYVRDRKKTVASIVFLRPSAKITYKLKNGRPIFQIKVKAKGSVIEVRRPFTEKELVRLGKKSIEKEIRSLFELGLTDQLDTLNLSEILYRKDPKVWKKIAKNGRIPLTKDMLDKIQIDLSIDTSGKLKL